MQVLNGCLAAAAIRLENDCLPRYSKSAKRCSAEQIGNTINGGIKCTAFMEEY
jgi:hypothetical protein